MFALDRSKSGRLKHFPSIGPGSKNVGGHEATQNLPASHEKNPRRVFFASVHKIIATFFNGSFTAYPFRLQRFYRRSYLLGPTTRQSMMNVHICQ